MRRGMLVLLLALTGCTREPTPLGLTGEQLMVHSVVLSGSDTVHVLLEAARPAASGGSGFPGSPVEVRPVAGADVTLDVDGRTVRLAEAPSGFGPCASAFPFPVSEPEPIGAGCYAAALDGPLQPGQRVGLRVELNGETAVEGEAIVPNRPTLAAPIDRSRHEVLMGPIYEPTALPGIRVRYQLPQAAPGLRLALDVDAVYLGRQSEPAAECSYDRFSDPVQRSAASDSTTFILRSLICFRRTPDGATELLRPDSLLARLTLAAFDSTYTDYAQAAGQASAERARLSAGVTGALGVFAGAGTTERHIILLPAEGSNRFDRR